MFKSINESLDKMCTPSNRLQESKIRVVVDLGNRREYVPFDTEWAAKLRAQDYAKCKDVKKVDVIDNTTGEIIYSSNQNEIVSEDFNKPKTSKDLSKWLKNAVNQLRNSNNVGCYIYKLDDRAVICVGWSDEWKDTYAGLKSLTMNTAGIDGYVNSSYDDLRPYREESVIQQDEDFEFLAKFLLQGYRILSRSSEKVDWITVGESLKKSHRKHRVK